LGNFDLGLVPELMISTALNFIAIEKSTRKIPNFSWRSRFLALSHRFCWLLRLLCCLERRYFVCDALLLMLSTFHVRDDRA
jgi:hypothetical protein